MSAKKTYTCDMCRESPDKDKLYCLRWDSTKKCNKGSFGAYELIRDLKGSDKHICIECINLIKSLELPK